MACTDYPEACTKAKASKPGAVNNLIFTSASVTDEIRHASHIAVREACINGPQMSKEWVSEDSFHTVSTAAEKQESQSDRDHTPESKWEDMQLDEFVFVQVRLDDTTVVHSLPPMSVDTLVDQPPNLVPVRNTFIHIPDAETQGKRLFVSAPSVMTNTEFHTIYPAMEENHTKGNCRPCAYFLSKGDGCRWGESCSFCHLCPVGALKKKKKQKIKALREQEWLAKHNLIAAGV